MEVIDRGRRLPLDELYDGYVQACGELRVVPLSPGDLLALLQALTQGDAATLH